ncbi:hypothetical protein [Ligilactobacillus saerimneri]|nr:hypothetical protein [Ligilactobacillus saerimneri]
MLAIDEKATIKNARNFFRNDLEKYQALSLSRYTIQSGMPAVVAVSGGLLDQAERTQITGVDAVATVDQVRDAMDKMQADNRKLLELKYFSRLSILDLCERLGYGHSTVATKLNQALLEFGLIFGLAVFK